MKNYIFLGFSSQRKAFESSFGGGGHGVTEFTGSSNTLMTDNLENLQTNRRAVIKEKDFTERKVKDNKTEDLLEINIMEQVNLLEKTPINLSMSQFLDGHELRREDVDNLLLSTLEEVETRNRNSNEPIDLKNYSSQQKNHIKPENGSDEQFERCGRNSFITLISGPYMSLTTEENNRIKHLVDQTQQILKSCCPVTLYQARVGNFMGTLSMDDMLKVFTLSRQAQNFMHYNKMLNVPFFRELTTRYNV